LPLEEVTIEVVCNANNVLCGSDGVSRVYGPQKGASPEQVELLSSALENYARIVNTTFGKDISSAPGSGASGGLGAGLILLNARLRPRAEAINEYFDLDQILKETWDCVFTAEGAIDYQSIRGKMTAEVARQAKASGAQVIALAGTIGDGADVCYEAGIRAFMSIIRGPSSLDDAINHVEALLTDSAEGAMRLVMVGMKLAAGRKLA
jgi:glycerate kinase